MGKYFLLVFDSFSTNVFTTHTAITTAPFIEDWWHYLASAYIFRSSNADLRYLQDYFHEHGLWSFLIVEVSGRSFGGWLPKEAWDWINKTT